jgi:predicted phosphodiesterase
LGEVLFCHATPRDENESFTRLTPESGLLPIFEGLNASVVVCGHTHMQFDRMIGSTRVVNAGSVGCRLARQAPIGCYSGQTSNFVTPHMISLKPRIAFG